MEHKATHLSLPPAFFSARILSAKALSAAVESRKLLSSGTEMELVDPLPCTMPAADSQPCHCRRHSFFLAPVSCPLPLQYDLLSGDGIEIWGGGVRIEHSNGEDFKRCSSLAGGGGGQPPRSSATQTADAPLPSQAGRTGSHQRKIVCCRFPKLKAFGAHLIKNERDCPDLEIGRTIRRWRGWRTRRLRQPRER